MKNHACKTRIAAKTMVLTIAAGAITFPFPGMTEAASAAGRGARNTSHGNSSVASTGTSGSTSSGPAATSAGVSRKPPARPTDTQSLEKVLGTTLTDKQKAAVAAAATALDSAMKAADQAFLSQAAAAVGLSVSQLQTAVQAVAPGRPRGLTSNIESLLPAILGRALTDTEKTAVTKAITTWNDAVKAASDTYREAVAKAVDLTTEELDAKVQAANGNSSGGSGGRPGGKGGGQCGPGGGSGNTTSGTSTGTTGTTTGTTSSTGTTTGTGVTYSYSKRTR